MYCIVTKFNLFLLMYNVSSKASISVEKKNRVKIKQQRKRTKQVEYDHSKMDAYSALRFV